MKLFFAAVILLFAPAFAHAAEAEVNTEFTINSSLEKTIRFVENNPKQLREAAGIELIKDLGDGNFKVKRESAKGTFIWIMKEEIENKDGIYRYKSKLVESIEGGIEKSDTDIIIQTNRDHIIVSLKISAVVNNGRVKTTGLRIDLKNKVDRVKRLLQSNLEKDYPNLNR